MESLRDIWATLPSMKPEAYLPVYERFLHPTRDATRAVLELGIADGGSLLIWERYFPAARIVGLDINPVTIAARDGRIATEQASQTDPAALDRVRATHAPDGFDLIIDDASHVGAYSEAAFRHLFRHHLKPGGLYVIEDWGTGYWPDWQDGGRFEEPAAYDGRRLPSHDFGMVGFIKRLVDFCHQDALQIGLAGDAMSSGFDALAVAFLSVHAGIVVVGKPA